MFFPISEQLKLICPLITINVYIFLLPNHGSKFEKLENQSVNESRSMRKYMIPP